MNPFCREESSAVQIHNTIQLPDLVNPKEDLKKGSEAQKDTSQRDWILQYTEEIDAEDADSIVSSAEAHIYYVNHEFALAF